MCVCSHCSDRRSKERSIGGRIIVCAFATGVGCGGGGGGEGNQRNAYCIICIQVINRRRRCRRR